MFLATYRNIQNIVRKVEYCTLEVSIELFEETEKLRNIHIYYGSGLRPYKYWENYTC